MKIRNSRKKLLAYLLKACAVASCVVVILIFKKITKQNISKIETELFLNNYLDVLSLKRSILNNSSPSNDSKVFIEVGGIGIPLTGCLSKHLLKLPSYSSRVCSIYNDTCNSFSCLDVLKGRNLSSWKHVSDNISATDVNIPDDYYHNISCSEFRSSRAFVEKPLSEQSENFPIAFNILLHKSAYQFETLLRALYRPQNAYCVHVDGRKPESLLRAIKNIIQCFPNVYLASTLENISYAGFSRLQADITCMSDHLKSSRPFKYLINTAAQAFPLKSIEEMVKILKIYNGSNDIEGIYGRFLIKTRYQQFWTENKKTFQMEANKSKNTPPPHEIDIVRGSAYGIFSRAFVEFIIGDQRARDLLKWARNTYSPDEFYWATLHHTYSNPHLHTPGGFSGYPMDKQWMAVYAKWGGSCGGKFVRSVCVNGVQDLPKIIGRPELFVNKFYYDLQPLALSCMASWIRFKESCDVPFDDSFYRTLNFIKKPL